MSLKRKLAIAIGIVLVAFIALVIITKILQGAGIIKEGTMTFLVEVPHNTPATDLVYVYFQGIQDPFLMNKTGDYTYSVTFTKKQLSADDGSVIKYRYSRNADDFSTAEYLEPDTNDYFWTEKGRTTTFQANKVQQDTIARWRWFPDSDVSIAATTDIKPTATFLPRVNNIEFRSGQVMEDLYQPDFLPFLNSTAEHLKAVGYKWVEVDPPWQWAEKDGLPVVENDYQTNPNYPDDATFIKEIEAYKKQSLNVVVGPQICCTELSTNNKSAQWWDQYFAETEKFLIHFADIAQQEGVKAFQYAIGSWDVQYADKWRAIFTELRKHFSGEIGEMVWNFGTNPGELIPQANDISWGDMLDYFYIAIDTPISLKDNPTDDELKAGADSMLNGTKSLYDKFHKPVMVRTTYFNIAQTWKGNSFYNIGDVPWISSPEKDLVEGKYRLSLIDQSRVINAYFRSIAERPWIISYAQFGYAHWENPLSSELSVRGKSSEAVWQKWNQLIYSN